MPNMPPTFAAEIGLTRLITMDASSLSRLGSRHPMRRAVWQA
jgi:hypothetical protein